MITSISVHPEDAGELGLSPATFRGLGRVVLLAGPNGSGKTRFLRCINTTLNRCARAEKRIPDFIDEIREMGRWIHLGLPKSSAADPSAVAAHDEQQKRYQTLQARLQQLTDERNLCVSTTSLLTASHEDTARVVWLQYPGAPKISDPNTLVVEQQRNVTASLSEPGLHKAYVGMHVYAANIARVIWNSAHPAGDQRARHDAEAFNGILTTLINGTITAYADTEGHIQPALRGRPFVPSELSSGERILISWAIALHKQGSSYRDSVVMLDEPENHLHPSACVQAIERLTTILGEHGQLWISTHSVPLVAHVGMSSVYLVKDGSAVHARKKLDDVMNSLLGSTDGRIRLHQMLSDADQIGATQFIAECLSTPSAINTERHDPQKTVFREIVAKSKTGGRALKLLDVGAGRGRLAAALSEIPIEKRNVLYYAYNHSATTSETEHEDCRSSIRELRQDGNIEKYYSQSLLELEAQASEAFDIAVLCNVLHEVPPSGWLALFESLSKLISPDGVLLLMEDLLPAVGELPHTGGYLMLDLYAMKKLFATADEVRLVASAKAGRLIAVEVPRSSLSLVTASTRLQAIEYIMKQAQEKIRELRQLASSARTADTGRVHAHYTVSFANAHLALADLR